GRTKGDRRLSWSIPAGLAALAPRSSRNQPDCAAFLRANPAGFVLRRHVVSGVPIHFLFRVRRTPREEQMSKKSRDLPLAARRNFIKGAVLTGAAALTPAVAVNAQVTATRVPLTAAIPGPKLIA